MLHYTKATFTLIMGMFIQKGKKARTFDFSLCHISFPCNYFLKHEISESQKLEVDCTSLNLRFVAELRIHGLYNYSENKQPVTEFKSFSGVQS